MADGLSIGGGGYSAIDLAKARQATQLSQLNSDLQDIFDSADAFKESQSVSSPEAITEVTPQSATNTNAISESSNTSASGNDTSSNEDSNQTTLATDTSGASEGFRAKLAYPELFDRAVNNTADQEQVANAYQQNQTINSLQDVFQSAVQELLDAGAISTSEPNQLNRTLSSLQETFQSSVEELINNPANSTNESETSPDDTTVTSTENESAETFSDDTTATTAATSSDNVESTDAEQTRIQANNSEEVQRSERQLNQVSRSLQDIYASTDAFRQSFAISA